MDGQRRDVRSDGFDGRSRLDTVEKWTFSSDFNHPVHLHLGNFQVITSNGKQIPVKERGWKDTANFTVR